MLRIMEENRTGGLMTLRLDGRLINQWVEVLRLSCEQAFQNESCLILDLAGVSFADLEGVKLLRQLEQQQASFINCSPFLREQIKQSTDNAITSVSTEPATNGLATGSAGKPASE